LTRYVPLVPVRRQLLIFACVLVSLLGLAAAGATGPVTVPEAAAKPGLLNGNPSNKKLATEFLRLLKAKDQAGLRRFLDAKFILQRGDGTYLTKKQYLAEPARVDAFRVRNIVVKRQRNVRVVRFEANTTQFIDGEAVPGGWIPRLSTFVRSDGAWRLIAHANFLLPPT
jgi:hypothetical protein